MDKTIIVRRNYAHFVTKYSRSVPKQTLCCTDLEGILQLICISLLLRVQKNGDVWDLTVEIIMDTCKSLRGSHSIVLFAS